jgi:hypothetical protein
MESEEYEQIPWSNLVADTQPSIDKRLYVLGAGVAVIVVLILAIRMFGSSTPVPTADPVSASVAVPTSAVDDLTPVTVVDPQEPVGSVTEADLMAAGGGDPNTHLELAEFFAEWFVTDFYTRDSSPETLTSLQAVVSESIAAELPHGDQDATDAFVEWARAFRTDDHGATVDVSVAFRSVSAVEGGFIRNPVGAVTITLVNTDDRWTVQALPKITDLP